MQRIKALRGLPSAQRIPHYASLANVLHLWVVLAYVLAGLLCGLAFATLVRHQGAFYRPWSLCLMSATINMIGIAVDYAEWCRIALLRSAGSMATFRYSEWLHNTLWAGALVTFGLAVVMTVVIGTHLHRFCR